MKIYELLIIIILAIILLKPNEIEYLIINTGKIIIKINKYIYEIKKNMLKL